MLNSPLEARHKCYCEPDTFSKKDEKEIAREERRRLKEERLKKKERKLRKKAKLEKECLTEKMNCFEHDNDHWRTAPLWSAGPFCFCMNANNNTYSCIRTINATHNFLYCEFTTGLVTYYNLRIGECFIHLYTPWAGKGEMNFEGKLASWLSKFHLFSSRSVRTMEQGFVFDVFGTFLSSRSIGTFKGVQGDEGLHGWEREGSIAAAAASEIHREKKIRQYVRYGTMYKRDAKHWGIENLPLFIYLSLFYFPFCAQRICSYRRRYKLFARASLAVRRTRDGKSCRSK